jgi:hypothetical protein
MHPKKECSECITQCGVCSDWWADWWNKNNSEDDGAVDDGAELPVYPIEPGYHILDMEAAQFPCVRLSFELVRNSLIKLDEWYRENQTDRRAKKVVVLYVRIICCAYPQELAKDFLRFENIFDSARCSPMLKKFENLGIEYQIFVSVVMHMFFLDVQKRLTLESNRLKVVALMGRTTKKFWTSFVDRLHSQQKDIKDMSVSWCFPMSFSAKPDSKDGVDDPDYEEVADDRVGGKALHFSTVGWMSNHHASFTRISLFQYSVLDYLPHPEAFNEVIREFRRLVVVWFCVVANGFGDDDVPAMRIDHLVCYFLTCCRRYHKVAKNGDRKKGFYENCTNFFSLLNCKELIEMFGSLRYLWEGDDEHFIKYIKAELATLRHSTTSLKNLLQKVLCSLVLNDLNESNPLREGTVYSRTGDFKVYRKLNHPDDILQEQFICGLADEDGNLYVCIARNKSGYQLFKLSFNDEDNQDDGMWILNLWYSKVRLSSDVPDFVFSSRGEVEDFGADYFLLLKHSSLYDDVPDNIADLATVICKSWKVRMDDGSFRLPMPRDEFLVDDDEDDDSES